jgi:hypothetical protein
MSLYPTIEQTLLKGTYGDIAVSHLIVNMGFTVRVFKAAQSVTRQVYGTAAGDESYTDAGEADVLITNDDFETFDSAAAGTLTEGLLFTDNPLITVGDRIEVARSDGRARRYSVEKPLATGMTTTIVPHFRVLSIGD